MRFLLAIFLLLCCPLFAEQTIGIFTYGITPWDPDSIKNGITGSEEAVIYVSDELSKLGYRVTVIGNHPRDSRYSLESANPRYLSEINEDQQFDVAICWRNPATALEFRQVAKKVYFWPHDSCFQVYPDDVVVSFDDVFWLSNWQRAQWCSVNPGFAKYEKIYGNGIKASQFQPVAERKNPYSCIYGSNYAWGLEHLLDIWPTVRASYPQATLDIYYGWQHWGFLSPEQEAKMRKQIEVFGTFGVTEHGQVGHVELNEAYAKASFWSYPCQVGETFCITALRAQASGAVPVIIDGSALKETVRHGDRCESREAYLDTLLKAMSQAEKITLQDRQNMSRVTLQGNTWQDVASRWHATFEEQSQQKRLIVLIIASDNHPAFTKLQDIWRAYMQRDKEHVDAYFLKADPTLETPYAVVGDTIFCKLEDSYKPGILQKTALGLQCVHEMGKPYDYVLRTNLSSFYAFDRLLDYAKRLPKTQVYASRTLYPYIDVPKEYSHIPFGSGTGFLLSPDLVEMMVQNKEELLARASDVPDDVLVGAFLYKRGISITPTTWYPFFTRDDWERLKDTLPPDAFHFRAKSHYVTRQNSDDYADELYILNRLVEKFYPQEKVAQ